MKKTNRIAVLVVFAALFSLGTGQVSAQTQLAGVDVDAQGILKVKQFDPRLANQRLIEARNHADTGVMQTSKLLARRPRDRPAGLCSGCKTHFADQCFD